MMSSTLSHKVCWSCERIHTLKEPPPSTMPPISCIGLKFTQTSAHLELALQMKI